MKFYHLSRLQTANTLSFRLCRARCSLAALYNCAALLAVVFAKLLLPSQWCCCFCSWHCSGRVMPGHSESAFRQLSGKSTTYCSSCSLFPPVRATWWVHTADASLKDSLTFLSQTETSSKKKKKKKSPWAICSTARSCCFAFSGRADDVGDRQRRALAYLWQVLLSSQSWTMSRQFCWNCAGVVVTMTTERHEMWCCR